MNNFLAENKLNSPLIKPQFYLRHRIEHIRLKVILLLVYIDSFLFSIRISIINNFWVVSFVIKNGIFLLTFYLQIKFSLQNGVILKEKNIPVVLLLWFDLPILSAKRPGATHCLTIHWWPPMVDYHNIHECVPWNIHAANARWWNLCFFYTFHFHVTQIIPSRLRTKARMKSINCYGI